MNHDSRAADGGRWRACVSGELTEIAAWHRRRQQRRALLRGLGAAVAGSALVGAVAVLGLSRSERKSAGAALVCDEVAGLLPAYVAHQLNEQRMAQVEQHLATCEHCTQKLQKLRQASSSWRHRPRFPARQA